MTLVVGTLSFAHFENWSHLDSAYYCVMTLTTIGKYFVIGYIVGFQG